MKFEVLKQSHLKRNIILGVVAVLIISAVVLTFTKAKYRVTESIPLVNGTINYTLADINIVALYIDGAEATELDSTKSYSLNTISSTCTYKDGSSIDNLTLSYDSNTGELQISPFTTKGTKCTLYFEEIHAINLDVSIASIEISEGSTPNTLYVSGGGLTEQIEIDKTQMINITGTTTTNGITVNSGTANITLNNVNINSSTGTLRLLNSTIVNLTIEGENTLSANDVSINTTGSGLYVNADAQITIDGTGVLNATGNGSGIGGGYNLPTGTIIINGGVINATSSGFGAGIGGGNLVLIEINGGNINATSSGYGAGIGGSLKASVTGTIRINGGTVYAQGGIAAAGIGGGGQLEYDCLPARTAPNIYISDNANVTAIGGGYDAEDIGNGGMNC